MAFKPILNERLSDKVVDSLPDEKRRAKGGRSTAV